MMLVATFNVAKINAVDIGKSPVIGNSVKGGLHYEIQLMCQAPDPTELSASANVCQLGRESNVGTGHIWRPFCRRPKYFHFPRRAQRVNAVANLSRHGYGRPRVLLFSAMT